VARSAWLQVTGSRKALLAAVAALAACAIAVRAFAGDPPPSPGPAASPVAAPTPTLTPTPEMTGLPLPLESSPQPTFEPSPSPSPSPPAISFEVPSIVVPLGHIERVRVLSPPSGLLSLSGFDPAIAGAIFNAIDRTIDIQGLHSGSTTISAADAFGQTASFAVSVEPYAGRVSPSASIIITGDPASERFVAQCAVDAAASVSYALPGAAISADPSDVTDAHAIAPDDTSVVHVPVTIGGPGLITYRQVVEVSVDNSAQPPVTPKFVLVSDFPETITEDGTLFYADVNPDSPARLLYYHYAQPDAPKRRVLVKVQNNGVASSLVQLTAGIGGPDPNVLMVGHESTKTFLTEEAAGEGEIFEVPPHATINIVDQSLPGGSLVSGLMQVRVVAGDGVRLAIVVQDAGDSPVEPISDTLLSSAVRHARGIYQVPDFYYDEEYTVGDPPTVLDIGKLPLPNLVEGEVLGGDYGVKQSASVTLVNPGVSDAQVGMWLEPRGGRATATFLIDGELTEVHATNPGTFAYVRSFVVPAHGYSRIDVVTMPEGGSSYPVDVLFSSNAPG
jgi:hypothetical protein